MKDNSKLDYRDYALEETIVRMMIYKLRRIME